MRSSQILLFLIAGLFGSLPANASSNVYTVLTHCRTIGERPSGAEYVCPGFANHPVYLSQADLRYAVSFGGPRPPDIFETFAAKNSVAQVVEWLAEGGVPYATLLRFSLEGGKGERGDVILVSKVIGPDTPSCPMAVVDVETTGRAVRIARGFGAGAPRFDCKAAPFVIGDPGSLAGTFQPHVTGDWR